MIKFLTLYIFIVVFVLVQTYRDRISKTLINLFLLMQALLIFYPLKNLIFYSIKEGVSIELFFLMTLTPCVVGLYIIFTKNKVSRLKH